jgi:hypothetical protein
MGRLWFMRLSGRGYLRRTQFGLKNKALFCKMFGKLPIHELLLTAPSVHVSNPGNLGRNPLTALHVKQQPKSTKVHVSK